MPYHLDENNNVVWDDESPVPTATIEDTPDPSYIDAPESAYKSAPGQVTLEDLVTGVAGPAPVTPANIAGKIKSGWNDVHSVISGSIPSVPEQLPTAPPGSHSTSEGSGFSVSSRALDKGLFDQLSAEDAKGIGKEYAAAENRARAQAAPIAAAYDVATTNQKLANNQIADITAQKAAVSSQYQLEIAKLQRDQASEDAADFAVGQAKIQEKMNDYAQSLKEFSMMQLQPGRAYSNLTSFQRGGVMATAFVQDFLGAKGIKTSGMDFINRGIDMDIEAQKQAMMNKQAELSGKQNLYAMQREVSQSDYEATVRTRGMMMEAMRQEVNGKLAAFDSPMAHAQAAAINAQFDQALAKNYAELQKEVNNQVTAEMNDRTQRRGQNIQASIAEKQITAQDRWRKEDREAAAKALGIDQSLVLVNNDGVPMGYIRESEKAKYTEITDHIGAMDEFGDVLLEYNTAMNEAGRQYAGFGKDMLDNILKSKRDTYKQIIANKLALMRNPDGRLSDADMKAAEEIMKAPGWTTALLSKDDAMKVAETAVGVLGRDSIGKYRNYINRHVIPIPVNAAPHGGANPESMVGNQKKDAEFGDMLAGNTPLTKVQQLIGGADSFGGKETETVVVDSNSFAQSILEAGMDSKDFGKAGTVEIRPPNASNEAAVHAPRWAASLYSVFEVAIDHSLPTADRVEAVKTLRDVANDPRFNFPGFKDDKKANRAVSDYANFLLEEIPKTAGGQIPSSAIDDANPNSGPDYNYHYQPIVSTPIGQSTLPSKSFLR